MNTTELIDLLKKYEKGGVTGRPREISFDIPTLGFLANPDIKVSSTSDGIVGPEITLEINGGKLYPEDEDSDDEHTEAEWEVV